MKNIKFLGRALMMAIVLTVAGNVTCSAYDFSSGGIYYNVINATSTVEVTYDYNEYNSYSGDVLIPSQVTNGNTVYQVARVGDNAFRECSGLRSVEFGSSISSIGKRAFLNCSSLTEVSVPASMRQIEDYAFASCTSLVAVDFANETPITLGAGAFMRCTALETVTWTSCNQLEGRGGLEDLGTRAFAHCTSLESVVLPGNLKYMGISIFEGCSNLGSIYCMREEPLMLNGDPFSLDDTLITIYVPSSLEAGRVENLYRNAMGWKDYDISELPYTFIDTDGYTYFKTSQTEVAVTGNAHDASDVVIRKSIVGYDNDSYNVAAIADNAFKGTAIHTLNTQSALKLKKIGAGAFEGCTHLTSALLTEGISFMGERAFAGCTALTAIQVPSTLRTVPVRAFYGCTGLTSVNLVMGVSRLCERAFAHCTSLTSIFLPRSMTMVELDAFKGTTALRQIDVDERCNYYASYEGVLFGLKYGEDFAEAEYGEINTLVVYPRAKQGEDYYIPCGVTSIEEKAFEGASKIKYLAIPPSITYMGADCFKETSINTINCRGSQPLEVTTNALSPISANIQLQVPIGAASAYNESGSWSRFGNIVERCDVYHNDQFVYDWNKKNEVTLLEIHAAAVAGDGTLNLPGGIQLSSYPYVVTELRNTSTADVASMVKTLNINIDSLSVIDMSDNINPLAVLSNLQNISISDNNPFFNVVDGVLYNERGSSIYYYLRKKADEQFSMGTRVQNIMPQAFAFNTHLKHLSLGSRVKLIDVGAFEGCAGLQTVDNAMGVERINERAFAQCVSMTTFNGCEELSSIGDEAFINCKKLASFPLGHSKVTSYGNRVFKGCVALNTVVIGDVYIYNLGDGVFEGCTALKKVVFSTSVQKIGQQIFKGCGALSELWLFNEVPPTINNDFFEQISNVTIYVPQNAVGAYQQAMPWGNAKQINSSLYLYGGADVNNDNQLTAYDVTLLYSVVLGDDVDLNNGNFDVNRDGAITAADITAIYDFLLNGNYENTGYTFMLANNQIVRLYISMSDDYQKVIAKNTHNNQAMTSGLSGFVDNTAAAHVEPGSTNGIPHLEVVHTAPGYCSLVAVLKVGNVYYYHSFPMVISQ